MKKRDEGVNDAYLTKLSPRIIPYSKYNDVLDRLSKDLFSNIIELVERAELYIPKLREILPITPLTNELIGLRVAAVDAGSNGKDLIIGYQPISIAVGASFEDGVKIRDPLLATLKPPSSSLDDEEGVKLSSMIGYYLMYNLASILLERCDLILIDGPLFLPKSYYAPRGRSYSSSYLEVYEATLRSLSSLLKEAEASGKYVLGVVKRIRSHYISQWLGIDGLSDSLISSLLMKEGEALGPIPISGGWEEVASYLGDARKFRPWAIFLRRGRAPIRLDLPEYSVDKAYALASYIYSISEPSTGLPMPILAVDRLSKVTDEQSSLIYRMVLREARRRGISSEKLALFSIQRGEND